MIHFDYLEKLMRSARRPSEGKPLDRERGIGPIASGHNMHNARLYKHGDDEYEVKLHRNRIATIKKVGNAALITVDSVDGWPTSTTAERLASVLGATVYKRDNKLRVWGLKNMTSSPDKIPPLADGMQILSTKNGLYCVNPELMTDTGKRYVGDKDKAKEIKRWLNDAKKLLMVQAKMGILTWPEVYAAMEAGKGRTLTCYGKPIDQEVITELTAWYGFHVGGGRVVRWAQHNVPMQEHDVKALLRTIKDRLYHNLGVYRRDTIDFVSHFTKVDINELSK
jgi:hypothetical protein